MSYEADDLKDERKGIVKWILDIALGRSYDDNDEIGEKIHRIGTINHLLKDDD